MTETAESIKNLLAPVLAGWQFQFGQWRDPGGAVRSAVLRPAGGPSADLVRRPQFNLSLIGADGGDALATAEAAELVARTVRDSNGGLVYLSAGEPVHINTGDGRPVFQIALSAITN